MQASAQAGAASSDRAGGRFAGRESLADATAADLAAALGQDRGRGTASPRVDRLQALRYLGYTDQAMDPDLERRFAQQAQEVESRLQASYCWQLFPLELALRYGLPLTLVGEGALELPGSQIARHLRGAVAVVLAAATLGFDCERRLTQLSATSPADQLLYSTCSSSAVESGLDAARARIDALLEPAGFHTGPPFAPGYGDLPIAVQPRFLEVLGAQRSIGLSVTAGGVLVPVKSVTACLGVFPCSVRPPDERKEALPCDNCTNRNSCKLRAKGLTCYGNGSNS
ncbi:MAG: hypothetical protein PUA57_03715 [Eggerthellales bacterium]|nr:hypothetical protein [Eggerthellales bacterium]